MKIQQFKTIDISSLLILMLFTFALIWKLVQNKGDDPEIKRAIASAESLSLQLVAGGLGSLRPEDLSRDRQPAANQSQELKRSIEVFGKTGKLSLDPWGQPYRYSFVADSLDVSKTYVWVWSEGPNRQNETNYEELGRVDLISWEKSKKLNGDDIGYVRIVKTSP